MDTSSIPDGYYNVCELSEEVFGNRTQFACANVLLTAVCEKSSGLKQRAGQTPWVLSRQIRTRQNYIADEPHRLAVYREICVHLAEVSSSGHNGNLSTLLGSVPVENERYGSGRTETFPVLQYKRLAQGANPQLTITVRHVNGGKLSFDYLSATLHIKDG